MNNETMENAIVEIPEENIENADKYSGAKTAAWMGLGVIGGMIAYDYIVKPIIANLVLSVSQKAMTKKKKRNECIEVDAVDAD